MTQDELQAIKEFYLGKTQLKDIHGETQVTKDIRALVEEIERLWALKTKQGE